MAVSKEEVQPGLEGGTRGGQREEVRTHSAGFLLGRASSSFP